MSNCHFQRGSLTKVAFVFACPGRYEEAAGVPCSGTTGTNLSYALGYLKGLRNDLFWSENKSDYCITNAWPRVEYKSKTGRSLPKISELKEQWNLERLRKELIDRSIVVCCGGHAQRAVTSCVEQGLGVVRLIFVSHLSQRAINRYGTSNDERLLTWSRELLSQI